MTSPHSTTTPRTIGQLIIAGTAYLERHGVEFPRVACELLACRLIKCPRLELFLHNREIPAVRTVDAWRRGLKRVAGGEPLQYVLGEWDFRHLTLTVDRRALIPRPETEQLVDMVLEAKELWRVPEGWGDPPASIHREGREGSRREGWPAVDGGRLGCSASRALSVECRASKGGRAEPPERTAHPLIVDVGTGSGCIVLSLASERPQARYVAIDASAEALALARANAARCGLTDRVEFRQTLGCGAFPAGSVDAIVANLPYIPTATVATLAPCIREHEPHLALDGGADGLDIVRSVAHDAAMVLRPGGWLFLEIGDEQGHAVQDLLESLGLVAVAIQPDLAGKTRFARARHAG